MSFRTELDFTQTDFSSSKTSDYGIIILSVSKNFRIQNISFTD